MILICDRENCWVTASLYDFGTIMADTDGLTAANNKSNHAVLYQFDIPIEENISGRNIYWSL